MDNKEFLLDQTTIKNLLTAYRLKIPDFQRSFVWKKAKKYQLLESLFRGFPIGAITLYQDSNAYYIIDGLQRINTLQQYLSSPCLIIPFREFFAKSSDKITAFFEQKKLDIPSAKFKSCIKIWYEGLSSLYEYEKVSVLYNAIQANSPAVFDQLRDLQTMEELNDILKSSIEITHDAIALIIYKGEKDDLPDLFKNINTGSVALSRYEILQSLWTSCLLDEAIVHNEYDAFLRELRSIENEYEIDALKEHGKFDIFKNIVGLNHRICCIEACSKIFPSYILKKLESPTDYGDTKKYYTNDTIGFELYSTILCHTSNKIVNAIDIIYDPSHSQEEISHFIAKLNEIIVETVLYAIKYVDASAMIESKYHSLYLLAGVLFSCYKIDGSRLKITNTECNKQILQLCLDLKKHQTEKWFIDENRQVGFFQSKIKELVAFQNM